MSRANSARQAEQERQDRAGAGTAEGGATEEKVGDQEPKRPCGSPK